MVSVKIDRDELIRKIADGDSCNGCYVLGCARDGSEHKIYWMGNREQWSNIPQDWVTIRIPALFPDGLGYDTELAEDLLNANLQPREVETLNEYLYQADVALTDYLQENFQDDWEQACDDQLSELADMFLNACNGFDTEPDSPAWGFDYDEDGSPMEVEPPAEFDWL